MRRNGSTGRVAQPLLAVQVSFAFANDRKQTGEKRKAKAQPEVAVLLLFDADETCQNPFVNPAQGKPER